MGETGKGGAKPLLKVSKSATMYTETTRTVVCTADKEEIVKKELDKASLTPIVVQDQTRRLYSGEVLKRWILTFESEKETAKAMEALKDFDVKRFKFWKQTGQEREKEFEIKLGGMPGHLTDNDIKKIFPEARFVKRLSSWKWPDSLSDIVVMKVLGTAPTAVPNPRISVVEGAMDLTVMAIDRKPVCFACGGVGHMSVSCKKIRGHIGQGVQIRGKEGRGISNDGEYEQERAGGQEIGETRNIVSMGESITEDGDSAERVDLSEIEGVEAEEEFSFSKGIESDRGIISIKDLANRDIEVGTGDQQEEERREEDGDHMEEEEITKLMERQIKEASDETMEETGTDCEGDEVDNEEMEEGRIKRKKKVGKAARTLAKKSKAASDRVTTRGIEAFFRESKKDMPEVDEAGPSNHRQEKADEADLELARLIEKCQND